jgi:hypothetical protein
MRDRLLRFPCALVAPCMAIRFEIYRQGKRVTSFNPVAATAMGPESVPISGSVSFRDGQLVLTRADTHALGVSLLWDLGAQGEYILETTRLPRREQPYILNVELARCRLMKLMQKQEDWNLFDFPKAEKLNAGFRDAQMKFAEALTCLHEPAKAASIADEALSAGIELSEEMACFHADLLLTRRRATGLPRHSFGCQIDPTVQNQRYRDAVLESFDHVVVPMSWKLVQPEEGAFITQPLDEWVELLARKRLPVIAGPLIDLTDTEVPDWMFIWEHDFETLRELAYEYVKKMVTRYRKHVTVWNVVAGLHTNTAFTLNFEQIIELTRLLVAQVKSVLPSARTLVTISQPYGEYNARGASTVPPILYAEMVAQSGINFDGFALELMTGVPSRGMYVRDLFQISSLLDRFSTIGRPVFVTQAVAPGRASPDPDDRSDGRLDPSQAGRWRRDWDAQLQSNWAEQVYKLAMSKPYVESVAWGSIADLAPILPGGGLLDDMFRPKQAFTRIQELREQWLAKPARK